MKRQSVEGFLSVAKEIERIRGKFHPESDESIFLSIIRTMAVSLHRDVPIGSLLAELKDEFGRGIKARPTAQDTSKTAKARVPSGVKRRLEVYLNKMLKRGELETFNDLSDVVQEFLFNDEEAPEDEDGELDLDTINDWQFDLSNDFAKKNKIVAEKGERMSRTALARELLVLAKELTAAWTPVRRDVDVRSRNVEALKSLTTFAPGMSKEMKKRMADELDKQGYDVRPQDLNREWSKYLVYIDPENNNNKYHYYVVYSFRSGNETLYVAANCSGRIGIVERAYDLTKKFKGGPVFSVTQAVSAAEKHLNTKKGKGYEIVRMTRG